MLLIHRNVFKSKIFSKVWVHRNYKEDQHAHTMMTDDDKTQSVHEAKGMYAFRAILTHIRYDTVMKPLHFNVIVLLNNTSNQLKLTT